MARRTGMKLEGVATLEAKAKGYTDRVSRKALESDVLQKAAEPVRERAAAKAPRGATGTLQSGVVVATQSTAHRIFAQSKGYGRAKVGVGPSSDAFYGIFQELGTSRHPAQPFLRPAVDASRQQVIARYRVAMSAAARAV